MNRRIRTITLNLIFVCVILISASRVYADQWFKGDFHVHTLRSGGDATVSELTALARQRGLDFIAITDHDNKMKGVPYTWEEMSALKNPEVTLIYGMEWTRGIDWRTCHGHMNLWSASPFDYSEIWKSNLNDDPVTAQENARAQGVIYSINHPNLFGFSWNYEYPKVLPALEIWNGAFELTSSKTAIRKTWSAYLNRGIRVAGVGGSDTHKISGSKSHPTTLGNPTTWVYARNKSASSILEGVKKGLTAVSFSPESPIAILEKHARSIEIKIFGGTPKVSIQAITLFKNGKSIRSWKRFPLEGLSFMDDTQPQERAWYYVELTGNTGLSGKRAAMYGNTLSISNAITVGF